MSIQTSNEQTKRVIDGLHKQDDVLRTQATSDKLHRALQSLKATTKVLSGVALSEASSVGYFLYQRLLSETETLEALAAAANRAYMDALERALQEGGLPDE